MGVNRDHLVTLMVASRESAIQDIADKMKKGATWEERSAAYPAMLRLCISGLDGIEMTTLRFAAGRAGNAGAGRSARRSA